MFLQWELIDFLSKTSGGKCFEVGRSYVTSSKLMVSGKLISWYPCPPPSSCADVFQFFMVCLKYFPVMSHDPYRWEVVCSAHKVVSIFWGKGNRITKVYLCYYTIKAKTTTLHFIYMIFFVFSLLSEKWLSLTVCGGVKAHLKLQIQLSCLPFIFFLHCFITCVSSLLSHECNISLLRKKSLRWLVETTTTILLLVLLNSTPKWRKNLTCKDRGFPIVGYFL